MAPVLGLVTIVVGMFLGACEPENPVDGEHVPRPELFAVTADSDAQCRRADPVTNCDAGSLVELKIDSLRAQMSPLSGEQVLVELVVDDPAFARLFRKASVELLLVDSEGVVVSKKRAGPIPQGRQIVWAERFAADDVENLVPSIEAPASSFDFAMEQACYETRATRGFGDGFVKVKRLSLREVGYQAGPESYAATRAAMPGAFSVRCDFSPIESFFSSEPGFVPYESYVVVISGSATYASLIEDD